VLCITSPSALKNLACNSFPFLNQLKKSSTSPSPCDSVNVLWTLEQVQNFYSSGQIYAYFYTVETSKGKSGFNLSWKSIRNIVATRQRVTLALPTDPSQNV
jgi:hypothetical protein